MIYVLVVTLIFTDPQGVVKGSSGAVVPHGSMAACERARAATLERAKAEPAPGVIVSVGCSRVQIPANA